MKITKDDLVWHGRTFDYEGVRYFNWTASGFEFAFTGKKAVCSILSDPEKQKETERGWIGVFVSEIDLGGNDGNLNSKSEIKIDVPKMGGLPRKGGLLNRVSSLLSDRNSADGRVGSGGDLADSTEPKRIELTEKNGEYVLFESDEIRTVKIHVIKMSECAFGMAGFAGLEIDGKLEPLENADFENNKSKKLKLEFIGDSITCGYGIDGVWGKDIFTTNTERADKSYAYLTAKKLDAEYQMVSWSGIGLISNYIDASVENPEDGWTMLRTWPYTDKSAAIRLGFEPEVWDASKFVPDIVVVHLGTNDMSFTRGKPDRISTFINLYRALLESIHRRTPTARICCCLGVMGQDLCPAIGKAVELFSREFPAVKIQTVIFPVQDENDGIGADWHPSAKTHEKMAEQLLKEFVADC